MPFRAHALTSWRHSVLTTQARSYPGRASLPASGNGIRYMHAWLFLQPALSVLELASKRFQARMASAGAAVLLPDETSALVSGLGRERPRYQST